MSPITLSVVSTLYQSADHVETFIERVVAECEANVGGDFEIVLVNDGSTDSTLQRAIGAINANTIIRIIDLSRNFGHHRAMMAGLMAAEGERVFLIDSDLEEDPGWLTVFQDEMARSDADVVFGVQPNRRGGAIERLTGSIFYKAFRAITGVQQPDNIVTARLMKRAYVDALVSHQEREINIGGLWVTTGFRQTPVEVTKISASPTTYTFRRKVDHFVNAITSFSSTPLVFTFYLGAVSLFSSILFIGIQTILFFITSKSPEGYLSTITSIWFFSGLILFSLGIQGIYLSKIFSEVKHRPYVTIRKIYDTLNTGDEGNA